MTSRARYRLFLVLLWVAHVAPLSIYSYLEAYLWTVHSGFLPAAATDGALRNLVVIGVEEEDLTDVAEIWPWSRRRWAATFARLKAAQVGAVGLFVDLELSRPNLEDPEEDQELIRAMRAAGNTYLLGAGPGEHRTRTVLPPGPAFSAAAAGVERVEFFFDGRGHVQGLGFGTTTESTGVAGLLERLGADLSAIPEGEVWIPQQYLVHSKPVPFRQLEDGTLRDQDLAGKVVLIGPVGTVLHDVYVTPTSASGGVELVAATLAGIADGAVPRPVPWWPIPLALLGCMLGIVRSGETRRANPVFLTSAGILVLWWAAAVVASHSMLWIVPLAQPCGFLLLVLVAALVAQRAVPASELQLTDPAIEAAALALYQRALMRLAEGAPDEASQMLADVASMETQLRAKAEHRLLIALFEMGREDEAALLTQTLEFEKLEEDDMEVLARELEARGFKQEARRVYEKLDLISPGWGDAQARLEELRHELSEFSESDMVEAIARRVLDDRFECVEQHGAGGGGFLFKVQDRRRGGDQLALKILSPLRVNDPEWVERFLLEARSVSALEHPNLVRIFDIFEGNLPYYSMEFFPGLSLRQRLEKEGKIPWSEAIVMTIQASRGLSCAHAAGLVHRDVKPGNLLQGEGGAIKVIDFGVARQRPVAGDSGPSKPESQVMGTPLYMAPEQLLGEVVTPAADVFALGVTLFELISGELPYPNPQARVTKDALWLPEGLAPEWVRGVLAKAMVRDPGQRYRTMEAFEAALAEGSESAPPRG